MLYIPSKKFLCQAIDSFGHLWNVTDSRPTEHSWNILLGFPVDNGIQSKRKGPAQVILTPELCSYLEEFRMKRGKVQLPVSSITVCNLRRKLGMNYWHDCKKWWKETENAAISGSVSPQGDALLKPKNLTWKRDEIRQCRELLERGMDIAEVARILGRKEKAIFGLRKRLLGLKVHPWTAEEHEQFLAALEKDVPPDEVAQALGRTVGSVKARAGELRKEKREVFAEIFLELAPNCIPPELKGKRSSIKQVPMHSLPRKKNLPQVIDCFGQLWDVTESRPTEHGWDVLLGFSALSKGKKGASKTILTAELRDYLELHRMDRSALRLPITPTTIHRLRQALGMNYTRDRKQWWADAKQEVLNPVEPSLSQQDEVHLTPHKTWTKEELRQLLELIAAGKNTHEIAAGMGKTLRSVDAVRRRMLGVQKKQQAWSEQDKETLVALRKQGVPTREIARILGRTADRVQKKVSILAPPEGRIAQTWTDEEKQRFRELAAMGHTADEIAAALKRTRASINSMWPKFVGKRRPKRFWAEEEKEELRASLLNGVDISAIAKTLDRSPFSVTGMRDRLGLAPPRPSAGGKKDDEK